MVYCYPMSNIKNPLIWLLAIGLILSPRLVKTAEFNPNNIISDAELQDYDSLGRAEIRSFLRNKNSALTDLIIEDFAGKNRYASEIIYQAAQNYQINPKYLLVKLQKEQSLINSSQPTQRQLDWATGYGVCDSCDTTDPALEKNKGFGKQVDYAAGIMRWYYENINSTGWIKKPNVTYTIDSTPITPVNEATAFLYTYTPHLQGNANFARLWSNWFSQVYPDGTLIKSEASSTIFAIINGEKRPIKNMSVLSSRFNPQMMIVVPAEELTRYKTGMMITYNNYSLLKINETYYLLDYEIARPFASAEIFRQFGYNPDEVFEASEADLAGYTIDEPITLEDLYPTGRMVTIGETVYYLKNNRYYFFPSLEILKVRFPRLKPQAISSEELAKFESGGPLLFPDATLVGSQLTNRIYVIEKGKKRLIPSEKIFLNLGYKWINVMWLDDLTLDQHQNGEPLYTDELLNRNATSTAKIELTAAKKAVAQKIIPKKVIVPAKKTVVAVKKPTATFFSPPTSTEPMRFVETGMMYTLRPESAKNSEPHLTTIIDSYIVARINNGVTEIVAEKNADVPRPLASLTKVVAAYQMGRDSIDTEKSVKYSPTKHSAPSGYLYKISAGDTVKNKDLLSALLISSFNTPALMLVDSLGKNQAEFVTEMNNQIKEWGLTKSYFFDAHGYDVRNQSTAREYVTIFTTALTDPILESYLGEKSYTYEELRNAGGASIHRDINTNRLFFSTDAPYTVLASKTGYLYEAGYNMAMIVERVGDSQKFAIISLGNPDYNKKYSETDRLTRWALKNF